ncbi:MAG: hypothetical protein PHN22_04850 [Candidatus ainarchaeum sp.]|nr:hypothetical protein [Candidatus ainarchaeum sp.]
MTNWISIIISIIAIIFSGISLWITYRKYISEKQKVNVVLMNGHYNLLDFDSNRGEYYSVLNNKEESIDLNKKYRLEFNVSILFENKSTSNVSILDILGGISYSKEILKRNGLNPITGIKTKPALIRPENYLSSLPETIPPYGSVKLRLQFSWNDINFFYLNRCIYSGQDSCQIIKFWEEYPVLLWLNIKTTNETINKNFCLSKVYSNYDRGCLDTIRIPLELNNQFRDERHNFKIHDKGIDDFGVLGKQKYKNEVKELKQ